MSDEKVYIVKLGDLYADGRRNWSTRQKDAHRFIDDDYGWHHEDPKLRGRKAWAEAHARTLDTAIAATNEPRARVVRLVKRSKP